MSDTETFAPRQSDAHAPFPPKLACALVKAQGLARAVEKDARNQFHKYAYASAEAVIEEARGALHEAGLACMQTLIEPEPMTTEIPPCDARPPDWRLRIHYLLVHESGESFAFTRSAPVVLEKGRPGDKAEAGAVTTSLSYVLRGLLLLPRVEEGTDPDQRDDRDSRDTRPHGGRQQPQQQPRQQAQAPRQERNTAPAEQVDDADSPAAYAPIVEALEEACQKAAAERDVETLRALLAEANKNPAGPVKAAAKRIYNANKALFDSKKAA